MNQELQKKSRAEQWHDYFMRMAVEASTLATCDRLRVGCILVKDRRIISTGFNGSLSGQPHCDDVGHLLNKEGRCIRTVHAEQNALLDCARRGVACDGAIVYCTHEPCENCTKSLVQAGIRKIYFKHPYPNEWNRHFNTSVEWIKLV